MKTRLRVLTVWLLISANGILGFATAQENQTKKIPLASVEPLKKMSLLQSLEGDWNMIVSTTVDNGQTWSPTPKQKVSIKFGHKGLMLEEKPLDLNSPGFHMHTIISYDQYRNVFRKMALDDVWGIMDMYEGTIIGEKLIFDNLKSKTFFPIGENQWRGFRLTMELKKDPRIMWIDKTDDEGNTWQKAFKAEYFKENQ